MSEIWKIGKVSVRRITGNTINVDGESPTPTPTPTPTPSSGCTITFNPDGGTVETASKVVEQGQKYGDLPIPEWVDESHMFTGWFTSQNEQGEEITPLSIKSDSEDQTLYAGWHEIVNIEDDEELQQSLAEIESRYPSVPLIPNDELDPLPEEEFAMPSPEEQFPNSFNEARLNLNGGLDEIQTWGVAVEHTYPLQSAD